MTHRNFKAHIKIFNIYKKENYISTQQLPPTMATWQTCSWPTILQNPPKRRKQ